MKYLIRLLLAFVASLLWIAAASADIVLHFSDFGPPEAASGSATVMKNLQAEQSKDGHQVYLVLPEYDAAKYPSYANPDYIIRIPREGSFQRSAGYLKLKSLFETGEVSAVHVHKEASFSRLGLSLAHEYHVPAVLTAHMMIGPFMRDHFAGKPRAFKPVYDWLARKVERDYMEFANSFDVVTAPTAVVRDYLKEKGVTRPILIIPPGGVPVERFTYSLRPDRAYLNGLTDILTDPANTLENVAEGRKSGKTVAQAMGPEGPRPRKVVVMLARLSAEKGIESVLEAWSEVIRDSKVDYQFVLAGLGGVNADSKRIFEALRAHPEAGKTIHYVGSLNYEDIPRLLSGSDVVLNASHHETFGLAMIEAGAAGRPVVAPRLPAFETFLKDGETAMFVDHVDGASLRGALWRIFGNGGDEGTYEHMSRAARANAENYSTESVNVRTMNSYRLARSQVDTVLAGEKAAAYFETPLTKTQLCRWVMVNLLTKP